MKRFLKILANRVMLRIAMAVIFAGFAFLTSQYASAAIVDSGIYTNSAAASAACNAMRADGQPIQSGALCTANSSGAAHISYKFYFSPDLTIFLVHRDVSPIRWAVSTTDVSGGGHTVFGFRVQETCPSPLIENPVTHLCEPPPECPSDAPTAYRIELSPPRVGYSPESLVCHADCQYGYNSGSFDDSTDSVQNNYVPLGAACTGEEDVVTLVEGGSTTEGDEGCAVLSSYAICTPPVGPAQCFTNAGGSLGDPISCPSSQDDSERCGFIAGDYQCLDMSSASCGSVMGKFVCFPKGATGVSPLPLAGDDPDNPLNGGNADGNSGNDVFPDAAAVGAGGLSQEDIKKEMQKRGVANAYDDAMGFGSGAGEGDFDASGIIDAINGVGGTLEEIQSDMDTDFGELTGDGIPDYQQQLDDANQVNYDAIGAAGTGVYEFDADVSGISNILKAVVPQPTACVVIPMPLFVGGVADSLELSLDTCLLNTPRIILGWLFYVLTVYSSYMILIGRT